MKKPTSPLTFRTTSAEALLLVANVSKSYGDKLALDDVSLAVQPGELVALLGTNGAGKSTLLQLVTGLFTADSGTITVCGRDIGTSVVDALSLLGVVFQQPTVDLELSVRDNLRFHAELQGLGRSQIRTRLDEAMTQFGLTDRGGDAVRKLSGGNRRRVELARALLHDPRLLVMDEATVGLDPASRRDILAHVLSLRAAGMGILWTTHLIDEAAEADRIVMLDKGKIVFDGVPEDLAETVVPPDLTNAFLALTGEV